MDHGLIKIYAIASVEETKQTWSEEDDFTMLLPQMNISLPEACRVQEPCEIQFSFKNPLDIPLTSSVYTVEGPGLQKPKTVKYRDIAANEEVTFTQSFTAKKVGERKIVVCFTSKQIQNITASKVVVIGS